MKEPKAIVKSKYFNDILKIYVNQKNVTITANIDDIGNRWIIKKKDLLKIIK